MATKLEIGGTWRVIASLQYSLTPQQQELVEGRFRERGLNLLELTKEVFDNDDLDAHCNEYNNVRKYISKLKRLAKGEITNLEFTEQQKQFMSANAANMGPHEMAKAMFPGKQIKPLSKESKTVDLYCKACNLADVNLGDDAANRNYSPPKAVSKLAWKINNSDPNANYNALDLRADQKKCIENLRSHLASPIFNSTINIIRKQTQRDLFEQTFIQLIYDRADVSAAELNLYVSLSHDYVMLAQLQEQLELINEQMSNIIGDEEDKNSLRMTFVEAYSKKMTDYNQCKTRIKNLTADLEGSRNKRMEAQGVQNASLVKLVEMWKSEDNRKGLERIKEAKNLETKEEVDRISDASELVAAVWGLSDKEVL